jgi:hypothetical protein
VGFQVDLGLLGFGIWELGVGSWELGAGSWESGESGVERTRTSGVCLSAGDDVARCYEVLVQSCY